MDRHCFPARTTQVEEPAEHLVPRVFVAVWLPSAVADDLWATTQPILRADPVARKSPADRLHVTLRFLGDQPAADVERLVDQLSRSLAGLSPFTLRIDGAGSFDEAGVVWARLAISDQLLALERAVSAVVERVSPGVRPRSGPFRPHVTLAQKVSLAPDLVEALSERCTSASFSVASVEIVANPGNGYQFLKSLKLGAPSGSGTPATSAE